MIRSVGRIGPLRVIGLVLWQLKYDLLVMLVVAAILVPIPDKVQMENSVAGLSVLGIAASIFIGFRNTNAYNRWWEARTLWGAVINDSRAWHNSLAAVDGCHVDGAGPYASPPGALRLAVGGRNARRRSAARRRRTHRRGPP